jgi:hypothetical protein
VQDQGSTPPANTDIVTTKKTIRWLWLRKQTYQFIHMAIKRKRIQMEREEAAALQQANLFKHRFYKEMRENPSLFDGGVQADREGEEWKDVK